MYDENIVENFDIKELITEPKTVNLVDDINNDIKSNIKNINNSMLYDWYIYFTTFIEKNIPNIFYRTIFWIIFIIFIFIILPINVLLKSVELLVTNIFYILYYILYWFWLYIIYPILIKIIS